jgi:hypothetical protein
VRKSTFLAIAIPLSLAVAACGRSDRTAAGSDADLQRDLKLASTTTMNLATPAVNPANFDRMETQPESAPRASTHLEKGADRKAVASKAPDLKASQIPQVATTEQVPQVQAVAVAPSAIPASDPVATAPRPGSAPQLPGGAGNGEYGGTRQGGGAGGVMGPGIGVIIRGGGLDGDHCEPHGGRGTPGIFLPPPGGMGGTTRFPVFPRGGIH